MWSTPRISTRPYPVVGWTQHRRVSRSQREGDMKSEMGDNETGEGGVARARVPARRPVPARLPAPRGGIQRRRARDDEPGVRARGVLQVERYRAAPAPAASVAAGSIKPGGTLQGGAHRRAGHPRPRDVHDLHGRAGLRQHLQQAHRPRHGRLVLRRAGHRSGTPTTTRPGCSTWWTTRRSTTGRSSPPPTSSTRSSGSSTRRPSSRTRRLYAVGEDDRGGVADQGGLPPGGAVRPAAHPTSRRTARS